MPLGGTAEELSFRLSPDGELCAIPASILVSEVSVLEACSGKLVAGSLPPLLKIGDEFEFGPYLQTSWAPDSHWFAIVGPFEEELQGRQMCIVDSMTLSNSFCIQHELLGPEFFDRRPEFRSSQRGPIYLMSTSCCWAADGSRLGILDSMCLEQGHKRHFEVTIVVFD